MRVCSNSYRQGSCGTCYRRTAYNRCNRQDWACSICFRQDGLWWNCNKQLFLFQKKIAKQWTWVWFFASCLNAVHLFAAIYIGIIITRSQFTIVMTFTSHRHKTVVWSRCDNCADVGQKLHVPLSTFWKKHVFGFVLNLFYLQCHKSIELLSLWLLICLQNTLGQLKHIKLYKTKKIHLIFFNVKGIKCGFCVRVIFYCDNFNKKIIAMYWSIKK